MKETCKSKKKFRPEFFFVPRQPLFFVAARNQNICLHVFVDRWRLRLKNAALSQGQSNRIFLEWALGSGALPKSSSLVLKPEFELFEL